MKKIIIILVFLFSFILAGVLHGTHEEIIPDVEFLSAAHMISVNQPPCVSGAVIDPMLGVSPY